MCRGCWVERGRPTDLPENHLEIVALIHKIYDTPGGEVGGPLHVALDDWNLEDTYWEPYKGSSSEGLMETARTLCEKMLAIPEDQRAAVLAEAQGLSW